MPTDTHEFRVKFTGTELESLAQAKCQVPKEFLGAKVGAVWEAHYPPNLVIVFTIPKPQPDNGQ